MSERAKPIGIFDSGLGGLTVAKAVKAVLPHESLIYLGDTARVPYGTKSAETVRRYALEDALFLMDQGIKVLVVACNTASAYGLAYLQQHLKIPVFGVIVPGARQAVQRTRTKKVVVLGTEGTVRSGSYVETIRQLDAAVEVVARSCPLLVPLAEEGWLDNEVARAALAVYLRGVEKIGVDVAILGCTHYPLFVPLLKEMLGSGLAIVDSAMALASELAGYLQASDLLQGEIAAQDRYFVTDSPERFIRIGRIFVGSDLPQPTKVTIP